MHNNKQNKSATRYNAGMSPADQNIVNNPADQLRRWQEEVQTQLQQTNHFDQVEQIRIDYLGRKGLLNAVSQQMSELNSDQKKEVGQALNQAKQTITSLIDQRQNELSQSAKTNQHHDPTLPGIRPQLGHLHPTTELMRQVNSYFRYHGYSVYEGPEIETDRNTFEIPNVPKDHPARDLQDTLFIKSPEILLRTQTSSVESRALLTEKLPLRIVVPGKVYRNETTNMTNNSMFYQYEGLVVDKNVSLANLKKTLEDFLHFIYGPEIKTRFRCKYYPQVEPGAGLDMQCSFCQGEGCPTCKHRGWIEVLGAGMVHPNMLRACNIDPDEWSGFAFGLGFDRLVMLKYGISDVRKLYNGELMIEEKV